MIQAVEKIMPESSGGRWNDTWPAGRTDSAAPDQRSRRDRPAFRVRQPLQGQDGRQHSIRVRAWRREEQMNRRWRVDQPPAAWPNFPSDHALAKSAQKRTSAEAMAFAKVVEHRSEEANSSGVPAKRPSPEEIKKHAARYLRLIPRTRIIRGPGPPLCGCANSTATLLVERGADHYPLRHQLERRGKAL